MVGSSRNREMCERDMLLSGKIAGMGGEARCVLSDGQGSCRTFNRHVSDISAAKISHGESLLAAYVVATDEETLIAQETIRCLEQWKAS